MIVRPRFKDHWGSQPDNSQTQFHPTPDHLHILDKFSISQDWQNRKQSFMALIRYLASPFHRSTSLVKIDQLQHLEQAIIQLLNDRYVMVHIVNETRLSYKGFISWILLANHNHSYIVDGIALRNYMSSLRNILENQNIVKLVLGWTTLCDPLKRDYNILAVNIFDMCILEAQYESLAQLNIQERELQQQWLSSHPEMIIQRPIKPKLLQTLNRKLENLIKFSSMIPRTTGSKSSTDHHYYQHLLYRYHEINQSETLLYYEPQQLQGPTHCLSKEEIDELSPKGEKLYYWLLEFREHVGKMHDLGVEVVLPKAVIVKILANQKISVLQISQLYEQGNCASVGLELCKRIYDVIQLNDEQYEDTTKLHSEIFQKQLSSKISYQPNTIKKLLKDLQWGDSNEWLNRKDDPSIKLYKEIISINEFDYSIGEEYINKMKGDVIKKSELGRYLKYAQYMRNKNYEKLENLYKISLLVKESQKIDEFSEETQGEKKEIKTGIGRKLFQEEGPELKSSTSLDERTIHRLEPQVSRIKSEQMKAQSLNQIPNVQESSENSRSRKSSQVSSYNINQLDQICIKRSDIRPLPNSIEEIYQLAQEVKKKGQKKVKKKQKKSKNEGKKDVDFIPTWDDIQQLMTQANNTFK